MEVCEMRRYPSAKDLAKISKPGRYAVGHGCYLQIAERGTRSWLLRYRNGDKATSMGLGSCEYVSLQEAREKAWDAQRQRLNGVDPLEAKREARAARTPPTTTKTFADAAREYLKVHEAGWRGDHSRKQWQHSLTKHILPTLGRKSVNAITTQDALAVLQPIWEAIPETARRVRNRIELILDFATAHEWRTGDNPARWGGLLENLLPDQRKSNGVKHLEAMPWQGTNNGWPSLTITEWEFGDGYAWFVCTRRRPCPLPLSEERPCPGSPRSRMLRL
jgi:Arm DNA-binding domain